jgi:putative ABC transport system substrate-binding protein
VNLPANWRRAAVFVDKILKGADPATLPVEPPQLELVINLRTAEKIGVSMPPEILLEASKVIQ